MLEAAATSFASILVVGAGFGIAAYVYHKSYKYMVLQKMANAFEPGDPVLTLAAIGKDIPLSATAAATHWIERPEQATVDAIVAGRSSGHYHLFIGEKGTGKSSMLLEAMRKIDGDGVAMFEAHADLEIFRIRLGKALDYEFHEDYIGGYFSERGPRDTTALLDIERALNKLEKVALRRRAKVGRPLVVIINQMHLIRDDDDGKDLIELLQQRAEQWAATGLVTMIFNSDDYWIYERLKQLATRMEVLTVLDLPKAQATAALKNYRERYFGETPPPQLLEEVYNLIGGRLNFLNRVAKSDDMLKACDEIKEVEKKWFLNQCWILGEEMDDDVMDQQKWAVSLSGGGARARAPPPPSPPPPSLSLSNRTLTIPPLLNTGRGRGAGHGARGQGEGDGDDVRPGGGPRAAVVPAAHRAADHDAGRLCAGARPAEPVQHHERRPGARELGAHAPRLPGDCGPAGLPRAPPGDHRPHLGHREPRAHSGAGCQGPGPRRQVRDSQGSRRHRRGAEGAGGGGRGGGEGWRKGR